VEVRALAVLLLQLRFSLTVCRLTLKVSINDLVFWYHFRIPSTSYCTAGDVGTTGIETTALNHFRKNGWPRKHWTGRPRVSCWLVVWDKPILKQHWLRRSRPSNYILSWKHWCQKPSNISQWVVIIIANLMDKNAKQIEILLMHCCTNIDYAKTHQLYHTVNRIFTLTDVHVRLHSLHGYKSTIADFLKWYGHQGWQFHLCGDTLRWTYKKISVRGRVANIIICFKFYWNRLRGFRAAKGQKSGFSIDLDTRSCNRSVLPWLAYRLPAFLPPIYSFTRRFPFPFLSFRCSTLETSYGIFAQKSRRKHSQQFRQIVSCTF